jgi:Secretion system C-terminal sorting domain
MLVSACLFASSWACFAQEEEYHPFLENSRWMTVLNSWGGYANTYFYTSGDTIIGEKLYCKLKYMYVNLPCESCNYPFEDIGVPYDYDTYLREDTAQKKVFKANADGSESTFYDFGLRVNDSMPGHPEYILTAIDTVEVEIGFRKRFKSTTNGHANPAIWIEGVGNIRNPFFVTAEFTPTSSLQLACAFQNNDVTYSYFGWIRFDCADYLFASSGIDQTKKESYKVYPNPAQEQFVLSLNDGSVNSLLIYDLNGNKVIDMGGGLNESSVLVNVSQLAKGIYLCVFGTDGKEERSFKLVKQ